MRHLDTYPHKTNCFQSTQSSTNKHKHCAKMNCSARPLLRQVTGVFHPEGQILGDIDLLSMCFTSKLHGQCGEACKWFADSRSFQWLLSSRIYQQCHAALQQLVQEQSRDMLSTSPSLLFSLALTHILSLSLSPCLCLHLPLALPCFLPLSISHST